MLGQDLPKLLEINRYSSLFISILAGDREECVCIRTFYGICLPLRQKKARLTVQLTTSEMAVELARGPTARRIASCAAG